MDRQSFDIRYSDLDPKPESLWRTSTDKDEDERTLEVGSRGKSWDSLFVEASDLLGKRFRRTGRGIQGTERTLRKGVGGLWQDGHLCRAKSVSLTRKL